MMEVSMPAAKEKAMTPMTMMKMQKIFSVEFSAKISPYPTVVIVVTV